MVLPEINQPLYSLVSADENWESKLSESFHRLGRSNDRIHANSLAEYMVTGDHHKAAVTRIFITFFFDSLNLFVKK